jgi:hypothetical protein
MSILRLMTVLWPGLPQLWLRGEVSSLGLAIGFSALLNLAIVSTWGWTELLGLPLLLVAWCGVALIWLLSLVGGAVQLPRPGGVSAIEPGVDPVGDLFRAAQGEYLRGNWFEAELALNQLLERDPSDVDARLMLATLLRRIGQSKEAVEHLSRLSKTEGAEKWGLEIARQHRLLVRPAEVTAQNVQLQINAECGLPNAA